MAESKTLTRVAVKDAERGEVEAVFSTFDVIDADGDVTVAGAFEEGAPVRISAYGHASWGSALPVGKGVIRTSAKEAVLDGRFFLSTGPGRETFETVKEMEDLQEWSYGFDILEAGDGEHEEQKVRFLRKLKVHEVSPVLLGAGVDTRTLTIKEPKAAIPAHSSSTTDAAWDGPGAMASVAAERAALRAISAWVDSDSDPDVKSSYKFPHHASPEGPANLRACSAGIAVLNGGRGGANIPDGDREGVWRHLARHLRDGDREPPELRSRGLPFLDDADHALAHVQAVVYRSRSLADLRAKDGRVLSAANRERLSTLLDALGEAAGELKQLLVESDPEKDADALLSELLRFEHLRAQV